MKRAALAGLAAILILPAAARAQAAGDFGIVFQIPTTFAAIWHASENLAVKPELSYARSSLTVSGSDVHVTNWTAGVSLPWTLSNAANVRTYLNPRFAYTKSSSGGLGSSSSSDQTQFSLSFGTMYSPVPRVSLFGDTGYTYSKAGESDNFSPRAVIGLVLYLGK